MLKEFLCAACAALFLAAIPNPAIAQTLPVEIDATLDSTSTIRGYDWGVLFETEDGNATLYARDADQLLVPASNMKIFTTVAALGILGETYEFTTEVYRTSGTISAGVFTGDIILYSEHDITWQDQVFGGGNADAALQDIAAATVSALNAQGITEINGRVEGFGAMAYDNSSISTGHVSLAASNRAELNRQAAVAFRAALIDNGMTFTSVINSAGVASFTIPGGSTLLHTHQSGDVNNPFSGDPMDLAEACIGLNKSSHNVMADFLLRHIAWVQSGEAVDDYSTGETEVITWMNSVGLDTTGINIVDGSGLSGSNLVTARQTLETIRYGADNFTRWTDTLPISGIDGTISSRLTNLTGDVFAKTGTLPNTGVVSLSGYIQHPADDQRYYFSIIANDPANPIEVTTTRNIIDAVVSDAGERRFPPFAPEMALVHSREAGNIVLWDDPLLEMSAYRVYGSLNGGPFSLLQEVTPSYYIESAAGGLNNADYSDTAGFENSTSHSSAPGLTGGIGSRFIRPTSGTGTATFAPSGLTNPMSTAGPLFQEASPYRVDVTSFDFTSANAPGTRAIITDADGSETITFELSEQTAGNVWRGVGTLDYQDGQGHSIAFTNATQTTSDSNDRMNPAAIRLTPQFYNHTAATANQHWDYYVTIVSPDGDETLASDVYSASTSAPEVLIVDGYDRWLTQNVQNPGRENHDFVAVTADAIAANGRGFASASNEALIRGDAELSNVLLSAWVLGEESSVDETFSNQEQTIVSTAAGTGHHLFVSGSEIAWDLDRDSGPSGTDRAFLNTVLGADLGGNANDDSGVYTFSTVSGSPLVSGTFDDGTGGIYEVGFPDVLTPVGAFTAFAEYTGGDIAGVTDGNSVIYLGFPFETILSQTVREDLMAAVLNSLLPVASVTDWTVLDY